MKLSLEPITGAKQARKKIPSVVILLSFVLIGGSVFFVKDLLLPPTGQVFSAMEDTFAHLEGPVLLHVAVGERVEKGQLLASINMDVPKKNVEQAEKILLEKEKVLPPSYGKVVFGKDTPPLLSLARLEQAFEQEKYAQKAVEKATIAEAKAQIQVHRITGYLQKKSPPKIGAQKDVGNEPDSVVASAGEEYSFGDLHAARELHLALAQEVQARKAHFEEVSLSRARVEKDRKRILYLQKQHGITAIPEHLRIEDYEMQAKEYADAVLAYNASVHIAAASGVIKEIAVENGKQVKAGDFLLRLEPTNNYILFLEVPVFVAQEPSIEVGDTCAIRIIQYIPIAQPAYVVAITPVGGMLNAYLPKSLQKSIVLLRMPITMPTNPIPVDARVEVLWN